MIQSREEKIVSSADNSLIRHVRELLHTSRARRESGEFVLEGRKIFDAARGVKILLVREDVNFDPTGCGALRRVRVKKSLFESLADTKTSQGVLALCALPPPLVLKSQGRYVFLDGVQDPGNAGAIIRSAAAFAWDGVILGKGSADPFSPKVGRASAAALFQIPLLTGAGPSAAADFVCVAADPHGVPVEDFTPPASCVLFIGAEGAGLSEEAEKLCSVKIALPMPGGTQSLNAAVSASLILYVLRRKI